MALVEDSSYQIRNFAASADKEVQRLCAQVDLFWPKELKCLKQFGLVDGMHLLECGSGPGHYLQRLSDEFPSLKLTGVEIDPYLLAKSKLALQHLEDDRCELLEGSILNLPFADQTFDFVVARLVLEHLPDPVTAAREMRRVLKPGGKVVVIDNDFDLHLRCYPDIPELRDLYEAYCACRVSQGGNPRIGRELPTLLSSAGLHNVDLEVVAAHSQITGDQAFLRSEGSGIPAQLVKDGFLPPAVIDRLTQRWHEALRDDNHSLVRQLYVAAGQKDPGADKTTASTDLRYSDRSSSRKGPSSAPVEASNGGKSTSDAEAALSAIWAEVLCADEVSLEDNFFDIGGTSIDLIDVVTLAKQHGFEFTPVTVFEYPTIKSLAQHLSGEGDDGNAAEEMRKRALRQRKALGLNSKR